MEKIILNPIFSCGNFAGSFIFVNCSLDYNGNINILFADGKYDHLKSRKVRNIYPAGKKPEGRPEYRTVKNFKIYPETSQNYRLIIPEENKTFELDNKKLNYTHAFQIDSGKYCFVCHSRTDSFGGSLAKNCQIIDGTGKTLNEFSMGTGINDIQTNSRGELWVSYSDTGIYSDFIDGGNIEKRGLNCFDMHGNLLYQYNESPVIDECNSLNVWSDHDVLINIYSGSVETWYAFAKITGRKMERKFEWREPARFMAFSGGKALVEDNHGGGDIKSKFSLVDIENYENKKTCFEFFNEKDERPRCVCAQKDMIFFWKENRLYKTTIEELRRKIS